MDAAGFTRLRGFWLTTKASDRYLGILTVSLWKSLLHQMAKASLHFDMTEVILTYKAN